MAFVNEREKFRTIDYERNIIFRKGEGGGRQSPDDPEYRYYYLEWIGSKVKIGAFYTLENRGGESIVHWHIDVCEIPDEIKSKNNELRQIVIEAFMEYGIWYGKDEGDVVEVEINKNIATLNR